MSGCAYDLQVLNLHIQLDELQAELCREGISLDLRRRLLAREDALLALLDEAA